jgi:hypothetical protein
MTGTNGRIPVRLVFADHGSFHELVVRLPAELLRGYERIIDALRDDTTITSEIYVDPRRLVAAFVDSAAGTEA